jgi:hypothetical protein
MLDLELGRGVNRIDVPGADTYFGPNFGANCGVHFSLLLFFEWPC